MKSNLLVALGLLILLSFVATMLGIWLLSTNSEFTRKDQAQPSASTE
jgi:hypothetical protein